jgi:hypothetical protein
MALLGRFGRAETVREEWRQVSNITVESTRLGDGGELIYEVVHLVGEDGLVAAELPRLGRLDGEPITDVELQLILLDLRDHAV